MKTALFLTLSALSLGLCSCSQKLCRVQQFERGHLSSPAMNTEHFGLHTAMTEHAYFSREASFGGGGVGGGGCGCN